MSSIRDQIVATVVSILDGAGKPDGVNVRRFSLAKIPPEHMPMVEVAPGKDVAIETKAGAVRRKLLVRFDVYGAGELVDQELDPALCWITAALQADRSLGGLSTDIVDGEVEWDAEAAAQGIGLARVIVEIEYTHTRTSQEIR